MTKRQNRMVLVALLLAGAVLAITLLLQALGSNTNYFYSPTEVAEGKAPIGKTFRLGGLVAKGSVIRKDMMVSFDVTDNKNKFTIEYTGILPDLFREGQGIITTGSLVGEIFIATEVLAKHDENYMPPEVADALEKSKK
ncbi:cytochrome c maturation protein CcmE [Candidatus Thioglobus sp.]|jgi:cytochrome c-type biogenesis protein CcmE|nr:cytochrome c maturation protein CcmE [Candidatus Thioglobus sp.]MDB3893285.1 cytochrome c maturation protein CcmE [Candidatus Thioglobus sp.]MDC0904162.1 cytochrome c maturation protein CcmE [Candidatus Thioglobus sp.]MDC0920144.1 cytochrome c maturation protein CcmE [Candidatus Thioglobus sp.]MDC0965561.1 cytochrome c maturation protein CcmE [Candidatus Thioglobus sp.]